MRIVKSMSFEIAKPIELTWGQLEKALRDVQYSVWKAYNRAIQMSWDFQQFSFGYKTRFGKSLKFSDLGTGRESQSSDVYAICTEEHPHVSTSIINATVRDAQSRFNALKKDILNGTKSIPEYKRNIPIPIRAQQMKVAKIAEDYIVTFPILSKTGAQERNMPTSVTVKIIAKGATRTIIDRIISGEYQLRDSKILRKEKAGRTKWYVSITYRHEVKRAELSPNRVMGVDMGVVNAAVLAFNFSDDRLYIGGSEISAFRKRIEAMRRQLQQQYVVAGSRKGHGRVTALRPIEKLREKAANFRKTTNHRYAKRIVEEAVKHGCGVIQLEDLAGVSTHDRFLKSWPYYDLQEKIRYKAEEHGIEVRKVEPSYTSQRCSNCGHICQANRDISKGQSHFKCVSCGYKTNADYNAARNIATPGIEEIIKRELGRKRLAIKIAE